MSAFGELPVEVGRVPPYSHASRQLRDAAKDRALSPEMRQSMYVHLGGRKAIVMGDRLGVKVD